MIQGLLMGERASRKEEAGNAEVDAALEENSEGDEVEETSSEVEELAKEEEIQEKNTRDGKRASRKEQAGAAEAGAAAEEGAEKEELVPEEETQEKSAMFGSDLNVETLEELKIDPGIVDATKSSWLLFINSAESREAAGEAIYAALFESAPSLQSLFTTPRAVQAMRFMNGLASFVTALDDPPNLKILVETLGFGHLHLVVTKPRVVIFRDAIIDLFLLELGDRFTLEARSGWERLLNYVGGAIIFVKAFYADRISTLLESWKIVNDKEANDKNFQQLSSAYTSSGRDGIVAQDNTKTTQKKSVWTKFKGFSKQTGGQKTRGGTEQAKKAGGGGATESRGMSANQVPTTYNEMFKFNAAVMGFGRNAWLNEVLDCFHNIVSNVSNSNRLQEECDVLALRIAKVAKGNVNLSEYKSCMLASLRSLLPKDWSTAHEVAWSWLWDNVERLLDKNMGNPRKWEKALANLFAALDENSAFGLRKNIYIRFFAAAPTGQDFFKQSNTYLHLIAERLMTMTIDMYRDPVRMVDDISALGLRHVGYGIPTELFGPFVSACVEIVQEATRDVDAVDSFRWSLGLIAKMLVRTINEGSTIVMKAVNSNSVRLFRKAIACAPRGQRASWLLIVKVGTQDISPLSWSIESGALEAASAIITDLLTIRADRDRYYYSMDQLFKRHPDIIKRLCDDAPILLPKLLDGLIWRSRTTESGQRRVNYYIKHILVDQRGKFNQSLGWIAKTRDPRIVCHPSLVFSSDSVWSRVASRAFFYRKSWLLFTLIVFITGQSIMKHFNEGDNTETERILVFSFRAFIYSCSMTQLLFTHLTRWVKAYRTKDLKYAFGVLPLPHYLDNWQDIAGFALMISLVLMLILEPILHCFQNDNGKLFHEDCKEAGSLQYFYSVFCMCAMFLYYVLLLDLAVFSTKVSAYVLVCTRMVSEVGLFLLSLSVVILTFSSAISILKHSQKDFSGIHKGSLILLQMTFDMFGGERYESYEKDPVVHTCVFVFLIVVTFFLVNMLIAQLTCAYESVYIDMIGYARLQRLQVIVGIMPTIKEKSWANYLGVMKFDQKTEFNAGDVGVAGGVQIREPASANPTTVDVIRRFGGSTSTEMPWPVEDAGDGDKDDRFKKLEKLIHKTFKRVTGSRGGGTSSGTGTGTRGTSSGSGSWQDQEDQSSQHSRGGE